MKTLLAAVIFVCLSASSGAFGQPGSIGVFADSWGTNCSLVATTPGVIQYFVVHVYTSGAVGCEYRAPKPTCFNGTWLSDLNAFPVTIGNSQTGIASGYGTCRASPIVVQTIQYYVAGPTPNCCCYYIYPYPDEDPPGIYMVDCADHLLAAREFISIINATSWCFCGDSPFPCINERIPVTDTTWGRLKAVYSD